MTNYGYLANHIANDNSQKDSAEKLKLLKEANKKLSKITCDPNKLTADEANKGAQIWIDAIERLTGAVLPNTITITKFVMGKFVLEAANHSMTTNKFSYIVKRMRNDILNKLIAENISTDRLAQQIKMYGKKCCNMVTIMGKSNNDNIIANITMDATNWMDRDVLRLFIQFNMFELICDAFNQRKSNNDDILPLLASIAELNAVIKISKELAAKGIN